MVTTASSSSASDSINVAPMKQVALKPLESLSQEAYLEKVIKPVYEDNEWGASGQSVAYYEVGYMNLW